MDHKIVFGCDILWVLLPEWHGKSSCVNFWACCVHGSQFNALGSGVLLGLVCSAFVELGPMRCVEGTEGEGNGFSGVFNSNSGGALPCSAVMRANW